MDVRHLSTSLVGSWPQCPLRAWNSYATRNEHGNDYHGSEPTRFGTAVHDMMERLHRASMSGEEVPSFTRLFDEVWTEHACYDREYHGLREQAEEFMVRSLGGRPPSQRTVGVETHFLLDLISDAFYDLEGMSETAITWLVDEIIETGGVPLISKIDRLDADDQGHWYVYDYKTNFQPFTRDEVENSVQLGIYDMAVRAMIGPDGVADDEDLLFGGVTCIYDMLRHGRFSTVFSEEQREALRHYLINLWHQIRAVPVPRPRINTYCSMCEIRGNCPAYEDVLYSDVQEVATDSTYPSEILEEWEDMKAREKIIKKRTEELASQLSTIIVTADGEPVILEDGREVALVPNARYEYDARRVIDLLAENQALVLLPDLVSISNGAVDRVLRSMPFRDEMLALKEKHFVKSSVKVRASGSDL